MKVFTANYYRGLHYQEYLQTPHWINLNVKLIDTNRSAQCWICKKTYTLLIHHVRYDNLFHERLYRDIYILCYDCHTRVHFYKILGIFTRKTVLKRRNLLRRMRYLKYKDCIQKKSYGAATWYAIACIAT
jgi:5-methylcytosine-specific restriction endonuclease McrA